MPFQVPRRLRQTLSHHFFSWGSLAIVLVTTGITVIVSWLLYQYTVDLLTERLHDRLTAIVRTAAVQFDVEDLDRLQATDDYRKPEWKKVVLQLRKIRANNPDVVFAYIVRRAPDNSQKILFVADADSLDPFAQVDLNGDGQIDDADALVTPSTEYEDAPPEIFAGFQAPATNPELYQDQWGWLISGYAPIQDEAGNTHAVFAIDIRADNFFALTRQTFVPFLSFIIFLLAIITAQAFMQRKLWQRQVHQLEEIDRQKDELISIVSHQLGGPITSIRWSLEGLHDGEVGPLTEQQQVEIANIMSMTTGLSELVSLMLDLSRIELGRLKIEQQPVDLSDFFSEIRNVVSVLAEQKGVELVWKLPPRLPSVRLDRRLTRMTLENLLNNAIKYTPAGGRVLFLVLFRNGYLVCAVSDNGCGIPKEDQKLLFTKLFRASNVRDTVAGNGFGLYIAKGAIEQQGGTIRCQSELGAGTVFTVEMPVEIVRS